MRAPTRLFLACFLGLACSDDGPTQPGGEGSVLLQVATYGGDPDPDGYLLTIDGEIGISVAPVTQSSIRLETGSHRLQLTEVASNCEVVGGDTHQVEVREGEALGHRFEVRCDITGIAVQAISAGVDLDASGYITTIGGIGRGTVPANGTFNATRLEPGTHTVTLTGLAQNCQFVGDSIRVIEVTNRTLSPAIFQLACVSTAGSVRVNVTASGGDVDERFEATVVGSSLKTNVANGRGLLPLVPGGTRLIRLQDVAHNCSVEGGEEREVDVPMGGLTREVVEVNFAVTCELDRGTVRITTSTAGTNLDTDYVVVTTRFVCDDSGGYYGYCGYVEVDRSPIPADGSVSFESRTGPHYAYLTDVAENCSADAGDQGGSFTVNLGAETTQAFTISCASPTILRVSAPTSGANPDSGYRVILWHYYYYYGYYSSETDLGELAATEVLELVLFPGEFWVELREINANCAASVPNPTAHFILTRGEARLVEIPVTCQ